MRVYGALMWSLGKVINTPEVVRVYLGSFWAKPLQNTENRYVLTETCTFVHPLIHSFIPPPPPLRRLFEAESQDLFRDIQSLPRNAALRKLNDLIKRARLAKVRQEVNMLSFQPTPRPSGKLGMLRNVRRIIQNRNVCSSDIPTSQRVS